MDESKIEKAIYLISELEQIFKELNDQEFDDRLFERISYLLLSILDPRDLQKHSKIAEFLLLNKRKSQLLAFIRHAITLNYSFEASKNGNKAFVSPYYVQWYNDGVMFLEGKERFAGLIGLYTNSEVKYAISDRDVREGEEFEKNDLKFISVEEISALRTNKNIRDLPSFETPLNELEKMIKDNEKNEFKYQEWIERYPWTLGLQYKLVQSHTQFDNENIPDFTAIRTHDDYRDIFEIKQPFLKLFRNGGGFTSEFNDSWNQVERYLNFVRENKDYLYRNKGLRFENPSCSLIIGYNLNPNQREELRRKEKMNPSIRILTYNDLIALCKNTIEILKSRENKQ